MKTIPWSCGTIDAAGAAALLLLAGLAWLFGVRPAQDRLAEAARLADAVSERAGELDGLERRRSALTQQAARARRDLDAEPLELLPGARLNARLAELAVLVERTGMVVDSTEVDTGRAETWYEAIPVRLVGRGSFPDCVRLLHRLHGEMPDIGVEGLHVSGNPAAEEAPGRYRLSLVWYAAPTVSVSAE